MPRTKKKPPEVGRILLPLAQPHAVIVDIAGVTRVLFENKHLLVEEDILALLRADELITPFREGPEGLLTSKITSKGKEVAQKFSDQRIKTRFHQLYFDALEEERGDAQSSMIVSSS